MMVGLKVVLLTVVMPPTVYWKSQVPVPLCFVRSSAMSLDCGTQNATPWAAQVSLRYNRRLQAAMRSSRLPAVKTLEHPSLLVVDEIGYLPINHTGAVLFFQLMNRCYEHASTVLASNKSFEEWGEVFGDDVMAAAVVVRVPHHCQLVNIRGNSYRLRQRT